MPRTKSQRMGSQTQAMLFAGIEKQPLIVCCSCIEVHKQPQLTTQAEMVFESSLTTSVVPRVAPYIL